MAQYNKLQRDSFVRDLCMRLSLAGGGSSRRASQRDSEDRGGDFERMLSRTLTVHGSNPISDDIVLRLMETKDLESMIAALRARLHARSSAYTVRATLLECLEKNTQ